MMRRIRLILLTSLAITSLPCQSEVERVIVKLNRSNQKQIIEKFLAKGYDLAGINLENDTADFFLPDSELADLPRQLTDKLEIRSMRGVAVNKNYQNPEKIKQILDGIHSSFPDITKVESIGKSIEGRDIWALSISSRIQDDGRPKPKILFNALHHAREVMTPEVALDTIDQLTSNYGKDSRVTSWVDRLEIWVIPMVNPDGSNLVWTKDPFWRKNARDGHGVDLNRNYPHGWNSCRGSSSSRTSDTYRGPSPASEPETRAMIDFVDRLRPVFNISYHSYSEIVLFPYGCPSQYAETKPIVERIARDVASSIPRDSGKGTYGAGTPWELLYAADGGDIDWMYHNAQVIPLVIELNSDQQGFQPPYKWRQPTVEKLRPAWMLLLDRTLGSGIRGVVSLGRQKAAEATVTVYPGSTANKPVLIWPVKPDGSFHLILDPGRYVVQVEGGGSRAQREVLVEESLATADFAL